MAKVVQKWTFPEAPAEPAEIGRIVVSIPFLDPFSYLLRLRARKFGVSLVLRTVHSIHGLISHPKTPLPTKQKSGVLYQIPCSCGMIYTGQTG